MDGDWLINFADLILFGNAAGAMLIFLTFIFLGRRASNVGIALGFGVVVAYFIWYALPIGSDIHAGLTFIAFNCLTYGCVWIVVARGAQFLGAMISRFTKFRKVG